MRPIYDIQEFQASILIGGQMLHIKKYKYFHLMRKLLLLPPGLQLVSVPESEELSVSYHKWSLWDFIQCKSSPKVR